jgi:hypothetical protein
VPEAQHGVGVRRHRSGDVEQHDEAPRALAPAAPEQAGRLAAVPQRVADRPMRVDCTTPGRAVPPPASRCGRGRKQDEQALQFGPFPRRQCRHVAVT